MRTLKFNTLPYIVLGLFGSFLPLVLSSISNGGNLVEGWTIVIIGCILFGIYMATINAEYDKDKIIKGFHHKRFWIRSLMILCYVFLALRFNYTIEYIPLVFVISFTFGIVFDPLRNYLTGADFFYIGAEAGYDHLVGNSPKLVAVLEVIGLIVSVLAVYYVGGI